MEVSPSQEGGYIPVIPVPGGRDQKTELKRAQRLLDSQGRFGVQRRESTCISILEWDRSQQLVLADDMMIYRQG